MNHVIWIISTNQSLRFKEVQPVPFDLILDDDDTAPVSPPASPRMALIGLIFPLPSMATLLINFTENVDILSSLRF